MRYLIIILSVVQNFISNKINMIPSLYHEYFTTNKKSLRLRVYPEFNFTQSKNHYDINRVKSHKHTYSPTIETTQAPTIEEIFTHGPTIETTQAPTIEEISTHGPTIEKTQAPTVEEISTHGPTIEIKQ